MTTPSFEYSDFPEIEKFCEILVSKEEESSTIYALATLININLLRGESSGIKKAISVNPDSQKKKKNLKSLFFKNYSPK